MGLARWKGMQKKCHLRMKVSDYPEGTDQDNVRCPCVHPKFCELAELERRNHRTHKTKLTEKDELEYCTVCHGGEIELLQESCEERQVRLCETE